MVTIGTLGILSAAGAESLTLPPHTALRIAIIQWNATKGLYEKWDAIGGDFEVSSNGEVMLPVVGTISVGSFDADAFAKDLAARLQAKIGLVQKPEAIVTVLGYPPIYVVGDVMKPGEYKFSQGMTVLQSLALSGGPYREEKGALAVDNTDLISELRGTENSILRSEIRIARLQAEMSGTAEFDYPLPAGPERAVAAAILQQEQAIFAATTNLLGGQAKSFAELRDALAREVDNLKKKQASSEADIASLEKELRRMKPFVEKKIIVQATQNDLERTLRGYYSGQLDLSTAVLRARQGITEASRNMEELRDKQRADAALGLQTEQANLFQLKLKREAQQRKLLESVVKGDGKSTATSILDFAINRRVDGKMTQIAASEGTDLQPGDTVRVTRRTKLPTDTRASVASPDANAGETSQ